MEHNIDEHGEIPFYVQNRNYTADEFPSVELLTPVLQEAAANLDYHGKSKDPYIAAAFNAAADYGLLPRYLLTNNHLSIDVAPDYYPDVIEVLESNQTSSHIWNSVDNDILLKRFALQLDIHSGEWTEAYQYATETVYDKAMNEHVASNDKKLPYYLISILMRVLKFVEKRDNVELINKAGEFEYHMGYQRFDNYSPKQFGIVLRCLSLSNQSSIKVLNADHTGRIHSDNAIAIIDAVSGMKDSLNIFNSVHDYKVYSEWLDSPMTDTLVMINNLLTIFNPDNHKLEPESGEVARMARFLNKYGLEKAILAVHNHGYSLEALEMFEGMPPKWVKDIVQEHPYDYKNMIEIIRGS